jgi:hypothetical protein
MWRCLRHTFAGRLVMAGVDLRTVQELMGHKTIQMTCRYAHLAPKYQLAAVQKLDPSFSVDECLEPKMLNMPARSVAAASQQSAGSAG